MVSLDSSLSVLLCLRSGRLACRFVLFCGFPAFPIQAKVETPLFSRPRQFLVILFTYQRICYLTCFVTRLGTASRRSRRWKSYASCGVDGRGRPLYVAFLTRQRVFWVEVPKLTLNRHHASVSSLKLEVSLLHFDHPCVPGLVQYATFSFDERSSQIQPLNHQVASPPCPD